MQVFRVLKLLTDGEFHSGQELGEVLGKTRSAIWKDIQQLEKMGLDVDCVRGRGYRIQGGLELLDEDKILMTLGDIAKNNISDLRIFPEIGSTNKYLLDKASSPIESGQVCFTEYQSEGRGRRGRPWYATMGQNLLFSVLWNFPGGSSAISGLSLVVGLAVAKVLREYGMPRIQLKWPNDVLCGDNKIAGILIEMQGDASGPSSVVVGMGINLSQSIITERSIDQAHTDVKSVIAKPLERNRIAGMILNEVLVSLVTFQSMGFSHFIEEWEKLDALAGHDIKIMMPNQEKFGVAKGVDINGNLLVKHSGAIETFRGGEISVRRV